MSYSFKTSWQFLKSRKGTLLECFLCLSNEDHSYLRRRRQWQPAPELWPGKSHGRKSLVGCSPWGCEEQDTTERLHFHFSLSCTGEGNGNPLQYSCLENPRDGGAWWAAIYGVAESDTTEATQQQQHILEQSNQPYMVSLEEKNIPFLQVSRKEYGKRKIFAQIWFAQILDSIRIFLSQMC